KQVFVEKMDNLFYPIDFQKTELFDKVEIVFATNISEIEIRKFRIFKNIKQIYFFPDLKYYNLHEIKIRSKSNLGIEGLSKDVFIKSNEISQSLDCIIVRLRDEVFFSKKGIRVLKVFQKTGTSN